MWLPTDLDRKSLYILQTESQSMNSYLKKWKVTCCHMMISCHLPILLIKLKWYTHLCKGCEMLFQKYRCCVNFSLICCETMASLATEISVCLSLHLLLVVYAVFPIFCFHFTISSLTLDLLNDLRQLICILFCIFS